MAGVTSAGTLQQSLPAQSSDAALCCCPGLSRSDGIQRRVQSTCASPSGEIESQVMMSPAALITSFLRPLFFFSHLHSQTDLPHYLYHKRLNETQSTLNPTIMPRGGSSTRWDEQNLRTSLMTLEPSPRHCATFGGRNRRRDDLARFRDPEAIRSGRMYRDYEYEGPGGYVPYDHIPYLNPEQAEYASHHVLGSRTFRPREAAQRGRRRNNLEHIGAREAEDIERAYRSSHGMEDDLLAQAYDYGDWGGGSHRGDYRDIPGTSVFMLEPGRREGRHHGLQPITWREAEMVEGWHMGGR